MSHIVPPEPNGGVNGQNVPGQIKSLFGIPLLWFHKLRRLWYNAVLGKFEGYEARLLSSQYCDCL